MKKKRLTLRSALELVEWIWDEATDSIQYCPQCLSYKIEGHFRYCEIGLVLGRKPKKDYR